MNLFINSPAYYTQKHGIHDEIYKLCSQISKNIDITQYTERLDTVGIVPIIAPIHIINESKWREERYISLPYRMANISIISDYNSFFYGDIIEKEKIIVDNILLSMKVIKKKLKNEFDYNQIEQDIMSLVNAYHNND